MWIGLKKDSEESLKKGVLNPLGGAGRKVIEK